jgi:CubicO group peptidase (beta-lactamase class C family)
MKKILFCLGMMLSIIAFSHAQIDQKIIKDIDAELNALLIDRQAVGFAIAITDKNKVLYAKGYGYKNNETKAPVTPNTLFAIGSCTKSFTSALLGILEDKGELSLNDSPRKHIPYLSFYNDEMNNQITIMDMMCHRTGLPRHDLSWYLFPSDSKKDLIKRIAHHEPTAGVREVWQYNNFMFLAQGVIAEEITGKSWEENVNDHFFQPLGMSSSVAQLADIESGADKSLGYLLDDDKIVHMPDYKIKGMSPAGSIYSSVNDMSKWVQCWLNNGKYKDQVIIPEAYWRAAITSKMVVDQSLPSAKNPETYFGNYGYGWFMASYKGHYLVQHGGNIDGFSARASMFPSDSLGIIVLANQNGSDIPGTASRIITDRILGLEISEWEKRKEDKEEKEEETEENITSTKVEGTSTSHALKDFSGIFENPGYGKATIEVNGDSSFIVTPLKKYFLDHYHYDIFVPYEIEEDGSIDTDEESPLKFNFRTNDAGKIASFSLQAEAGLDPIIFEKIPTIIEVESGSFEKYSGTYILGNMEAKVYTKGDELKLFVPGQPEYNLLPTAYHEFTIENLKGFSLLFSEEEGVISAVTFHQPNGVFKATKKE